MTAFPQYAKSTDAAVIETIERNVQGLSDFHDKACAFAEAHGAPLGGYYRSSFAGGHRIQAISGEKPTTGRWKRGSAGRGWVPFKNDPLYAQFEAISFDEERIAGLPMLVNGPYLPNGSHLVATPRPFLHDGAAFVGFNFTPVEGGLSTAAEPADGGWEEILASEYHLAVEAAQAAATSAVAA